MRVVLDTNVLARAARPSPGPAREVLIRCLEDPHVLLLSGFILAELHRVLRYERVRQIHRLNDAGIDRYVADVEMAGVTIVLPPAPTVAFVHADPEDDPIVHTAVFGRADVLCTRDRHLRQPHVVGYCGVHGIAVLDDLGLLARLREDDQERAGR